MRTLLVFSFFVTFLISCGPSQQEYDQVVTRLSVANQNLQAKSKQAAQQGQLIDSLRQVADGCFDAAMDSLQRRQEAIQAENTRLGLQELDLSTFAIEITPDQINPFGLIEALDDIDWVIETKGGILGDAIPSMRGSGWSLADGAWDLVKYDLRNADNLSKFWQNHKKKVLTLLTLTGKRHQVAGYCVRVLPHYEGKTDQAFAAAADAYVAAYPAGDQYGGHHTDSPEYQAARNLGSKQELNDYLRYLRTRQAGGNELVRLYVRIMRDIIG